MAFLGYALFSGELGSFTVPVVEVESFTFPTGLSAKTINISTETFNSIQWNTSQSIFALNSNPPTSLSNEKPFTAISSGTLQISAQLSSGTPRLNEWLNGEYKTSHYWNTDLPPYIQAIFRFKNISENRYFFKFSYHSYSTLPDGVAAQFLFTPEEVSWYVENLVIQSNPVIIGVSPKFELTSPELPLYMSRGQSTELSFSLTVDGVTTENAPFTFDDTQPDAYGVTKWMISGSTLTITNECWAQELFIYFHPVEYTELEYVLTVSVTDPVSPPSPYNPPGGGTGGSGIPTGPGGGGGTFPSGPGPSMVENIPTGQTGNDLANSGLFTMYLMNQSYMNLIGEIMWEDNLGIQALKAVFGQPIDAIISTMSYPFDLTNFVTKTAQNLFFGPWNSGLPFQALTKSSFQIDWGIITIPFGWGNFLDYAPHTKMELFLPWGPGYVPIDPNDVSPFSNTPGNFNVGTFTNGSIQVKTNIELGKGTCVHNVIGNNGKVIGSYSGIVGKQVPMTALDTGGKLLTTIGAVATMTAGAATAAGAMAGKFNTGQMSAHKQVDPLLNRPMFADAGYMQKASEGVSTVNRGANMAASALLSNPISFPRAGTFSDGSSAMTVQQPFLLISRPVQSVPTQYGHYNGYPSNIHYANLSGLSGYTEISEIHLDNVTATADELAELDGVLKGGILL